MEKAKLSGGDWGRAIMGAGQIAVIVSLGMYLMIAVTIDIGVMFRLSILIGALAGFAVVSGSGKVAAIKWVVSIPFSCILMLIAAKTMVNHRLSQALKVYGRWSGDGFGIMIGIIIAAFCCLVFIGVGAWYSGYGKKSRKFRAVLVIQNVLINIVCVGLIIIIVALNLTLPPYLPEINYT